MAARFLQLLEPIWFCSPPGPDVICRWWASAITMAVSWLQGDDAAVHAHFTEVERVPKALDVTECVAHLDPLARFSPGKSRRCRSGLWEGASLGVRQGAGSGSLGTL